LWRANRCPDGVGRGRQDKDLRRYGELEVKPGEEGSKKGMVAVLEIVYKYRESYHPILWQTKT